MLPGDTNTGTGSVNAGMQEALYKCWNRLLGSYIEWPDHEDLQILVHTMTGAVPSCNAHTVSIAGLTEGIEVV